MFAVHILSLYSCVVLIPVSCNDHYLLFFSLNKQSFLTDRLLTCILIAVLTVLTQLLILINFN